MFARQFAGSSPPGLSEPQFSVPYIGTCSDAIQSSELVALAVLVLQIPDHQCRTTWGQSSDTGSHEPPKAVNSTQVSVRLGLPPVLIGIYDMNLDIDNWGRYPQK